MESDRVRANTNPEILDEIDRNIEESILFYSMRSKADISARIGALEEEWDIERYLEVNASAIGLGGVVLGFTVNKKWFLLTGGVMAFLLQHAVQGWCPPIPALRRLGIRTRVEIDRERYALKALRGDFDAMRDQGDTLNRAHEALLAAVV